MAIRLELAQSVQEIQRANHVVHLREDGVLAVDHRVRGGALFGKVYDRLRPKSRDGGGEKIVIRHIAYEKLNLLPGELLPNPKAIGQSANRRQGLHAEFVVPLAADEVIDNRDRMPLLRQVKSCSPTAITIPSKHSNPHLSPLSSESLTLPQAMLS